MEKIVKCPKRQDCHYKLTPGSSNETSINLSNEVFKVLRPEGTPTDVAVDVEFTIFKEDFVKALCYLMGKLPLYKTASGKSTEITYSNEFFGTQCDVINNFFGQSNTAIYHAKLLYREDGRIYLNDLNDNGFNVRRFLIEGNSVLVFLKEESNTILRIETGEEVFAMHTRSGADTLDNDIANTPNIPLQTIYFGSPGTGKSFKIKDKILKGVDDNYIFRTTFHPDTDYASFVGCYKPITNKTKQSSKVYTIEELADIYKRDVGPTEHLKTGHIEPRIQFGIEYCEYFGGTLGNYSINQMLELADKELYKGCIEDRVGITHVGYGVRVGLKLGYSKSTNTITYDFAPQTFTNAYVKAWQNPTENVYLVIEEINRGNCAQIFGDLFQLLDRNDDGVSEYPIKADADLTKYLQETLGEDHEGIADGKIKLPANLYILATMNTSDQSLFPMDSAFKRRWEWQYVPTSVTGDKKKVLKVESNEEKVLINRDQAQKVLKVGMYQYDWSLFLEKINKCITDATHSDDKQLGFWFVKTPKDSNEIKIETFVSKVIFYLWTDVFKDFGAKATNPFAFKTSEGGWIVCPFSSFFDQHTGDINLGQIHGFMYNLGIVPDVEPEIQAAIDQRNEEEGNPKA